MKGRTIADRSRNTSRLMGPTTRVSQQERRSIAADKPIDWPPNQARDNVNADRSWDSSDRSAKPPDALRRRFPNFLGSEFPPKLGQTLCSINRTQFGRKRGNWTERKTQILTKKLKKKKNKLVRGQEDSRKLSKTSRLRVYSISFFFISFSIIFLVMNMNSIVYINLLLAMRG